MNQPAKKPLKKKKLAINILALAIGMFGLGYGAVPLYDLFCKVTGFGGTTQTSEVYPDYISDREITVRFNADINRDLYWEFKPEQVSQTIRIGEPGLAYYYAVNKSDRPLTGTSIYNVTPNKAGQYFSKVECFCFDEQMIQPGEKVRFPVSFYVDPEMVNDDNLDDVNTITLSYTFFKVKE